MGRETFIHAAIIGGIALLAGCTTVNDTADSVSNGASAGYQEAKAAASDTAAAVGAGVNEAAGHAGNFASATKERTYGMVDHMADWMRPSSPKPPLPIAASYCYHAYQDILCYRRPMPGWEGRLAGYQPLTAEPPPLAVMQPLASRALDPSRLPANRVAGSKPVFADMPTQPKDAEKPTDEPATPAAAAAAASDATHEQLPDPALAPQLQGIVVRV